MGKLNLYEKLVKYDEFFALSQVCLNNLMLLKNNSNAPLKKKHSKAISLLPKAASEIQIIHVFQQ